MVKSLFINFKEDVSSIELPQRFNFPFYYEPHDLSRIAAKELQEYINTQEEWNHNFGLDESAEGLAIGKMFGVLVVKNTEGKVGYLAAFSGKLAEKNNHPFFVPPVFDILHKDSFFLKEEKILNQINRDIERIENDPVYIQALQTLEENNTLSKESLDTQKAIIKTAKKARQEKRNIAQKQMTEKDFAALKEELRQESLKYNYYFKDLNRYWNERLNAANQEVAHFKEKIELLKKERKTRSAALQARLFSNYQFLNANKEMKSLLEIFQNTVQKTPPAGAGECAAPKLLHYAYQKDLQPVAMAEFWWGTSPNSEIRKQGNFYPACRGKCEPILNHMLEGLVVDENPMLQNSAEGKQIEIIFENEHLAVISKPAEFLSVPGINVEDSVFTRMKAKYPFATGPMIVHRLDMSTSGLLLISKTKEVNKFLQRQFINRTVEKTYVALLDGIIAEDEGTIALPLRVDLDNRPQQLVCYEHGKLAITKWKVKERKNGKTKIYFYPVTGRTHQLRVHAAHPSGLNTPIVGDDLYGIKADRLHLHAASITFKMPVTKEIVTFNVKEEF